MREGAGGDPARATPESEGKAPLKCRFKLEGMQTGFLGILFWQSFLGIAVLPKEGEWGVGARENLVGKEGKVARVHAGGSAGGPAAPTRWQGVWVGRDFLAQVDPGGAAQERSGAEQDGPRKPFPTQTPSAGGTTDRSKRRGISAWSSRLENKRRIDRDGVKVSAV